MKNTIKLPGIAAIIVVIGFLFAACGGGNNDPGDLGPGGEPGTGEKPDFIAVPTASPAPGFTESTRLR